MEPNLEQVTVKKKGAKKWILGSIVAVVVLGALGFSMANEIMAKIAPHKYVLLSLLEMQKMAEQDTKISYGANNKTSIDLTLKEIEGMYDDYYREIIEGLGLSLSVTNNTEGIILIDTSLKKSGTSLMDLSIYSSSNELGIKIPGVLDQYAMVNLNQFKEQYDMSGLSYYMGRIEQEEVTLLQDSIDQFRKALTGQAADTYTDLGESYKEAFMDIAKNIDIKHTGTTKVKINNKNKKGNKFTIMIDSRDMKSLVRELTRATLKNKNFKESIEALLLMDGGYYTIDEWEEDIYEALDQINFSDAEINCVIDCKRRIVSADLITSMSVDGDKVKISTDYALFGDDHLFDQIEANAKFQSDYDNVQFSFERNRAFLNKKTKTSEDTVFRIKSDSDQIMKASWNIEQDLQAKTDNYALTANLTTDEYTNINLKLSGDLSVTKDHSEMSLYANKIALNIESYGEVFNVLGSGYFGTKDLKDDDINISDQQKLDLFSLDASQMLDLISRIGTQFYQLENIIDSI